MAHRITPGPPSPGGMAANPCAHPLLFPASGPFSCCSLDWNSFPPSPCLTPTSGAQQRGCLLPGLWPGPVALLWAPAAPGLSDRSKVPALGLRFRGGPASPELLTQDLCQGQSISSEPEWPQQWWRSQVAPGWGPPALTRGALKSDAGDCVWMFRHMWRAGFAQVDLLNSTRKRGNVVVSQNITSFRVTQIRFERWAQTYPTQMY